MGVKSNHWFLAEQKRSAAAYEMNIPFPYKGEGFEIERQANSGWLSVWFKYGMVELHLPATVDMVYTIEKCRKMACLQSQLNGVLRKIQQAEQEDAFELTDSFNSILLNA
jgi:hypothetical protein